MPRTPLAVQPVPPAGIAGALTAANADGHEILAPAGTLLEVVNGSGAPIDVTVPSTLTRAGLSLPNQVTAVPDGARRMIPLGAEHQRQPNGSVHVDFSAVTTVTCGAIVSAG